MLFQSNNESDVSMESPDAASVDLNESIGNTDAGLQNAIDGNCEPMSNDNETN